MYVSTATRAKGRRRLFAALVVVGGVAAILVVAVGALALSGKDTLPARTTIAGVDVGGMTRAEAETAVNEAADARRLQPMTLAVPSPGGATTVTITGALLGARPRVQEALDRADDPGVAARLTRRVGIGAARVVPLRFDFDQEQLARLRDDIESRVVATPRDASLSIGAKRATVRVGVTGQSLDADRLVSRLSLLAPSVAVPVTVVQPRVTTDAARAAAAQVAALLAVQRRVAIGGTSVALPPAVVRRALVIEPQDGRLVVSLDAGTLRKRLRPAFIDRLRVARSAAFRVDGSRVAVVPSAPGREIDTEAISRAVLEFPARRVHRARFRSVAPALTTKEAHALGIRQLVSEFTTYYPCCAPRVTNIQRAAQVLDGTVVRPGASFSLNDALGQRTEEKGYVAAPQILAGRLEDAVGGGISQVATTLFNAAFFAGLRLDAHQAHQFYISRYPMGREATVSWGGPELIFTNDWKAGLLLKVSAWSTGISVRMFSSKLGRRVETVTDEPYAFREPTTRTTRNLSLAPGTRNVLQEAGGSGFTVEFTRKVFRGDELLRDERYRTRYDAQNAFIEIGPPKPKPKPKPDPKPADEGADTTKKPPAGDDAVVPDAPTGTATT